MFVWRATSRNDKMDVRQKLYDDLERYRALRDMTTDEAAIEAIDVMIRETEDCIAKLEEEQADRPGLSVEG
jgi:hypothetical protein